MYVCVFVCALLATGIYIKIFDNHLNLIMLVPQVIMLVLVPLVIM